MPEARDVTGGFFSPPQMNQWRGPLASGVVDRTKIQVPLTGSLVISNRRGNKGRILENKATQALIRSSKNLARSKVSVPL